MIPKIIHYCWFGKSPLPPLAIKCINSWKKYFPDYEIKEWNEENFNVDIIPYTSEAYQKKKYAFVSDYARFWILYNYGGVYFDTDVEVIKSFEDIIKRGSFMGLENEISDINPHINVAPGLGLGASKGMGIYREIIDNYENIHFYENGILNMTTVVEYVTTLLKNKGLKNKGEIQNIENITIYPAEYFCPLNYETGKYVSTSDTRSIHHYNASWKSKKEKIKKRLVYLLGLRTIKLLKKIICLYK